MHPIGPDVHIGPDRGVVGSAGVLALVRGHDAVVADSHAVHAQVVGGADSSRGYAWPRPPRRRRPARGDFVDAKRNLWGSPCYRWFVHLRSWMHKPPLPRSEVQFLVVSDLDERDGDEADRRAEHHEESDRDPTAGECGEQSGSDQRRRAADDCRSELVAQ